MTVRRLLTVGRSYAVGLNRRLAHEMAVAGAGRWEVTAVAPRFVHGDLRPIALEPIPGEACRLVPVNAYLTRAPHVMWYGRELGRLVRGERWNLVHAWEEPYIVPGFQVSRLVPPRVPFVFWTAQNLAKRYPPPFSWMEAACLRRAAGWLACGHTTAEVQLRRGYDRTPHRVMPLGVDTAAFRPDPAARDAVRRELGWAPDGPPVVGYSGRFLPQKGIRVLTAAMDALRTEWRALFVGGGPSEAELRTWATRHGDRVRIVTGVPHDRVPAHLNAMDVLAAPSQTIPRWREQLGRMLIEAFACGVPVVGSDSGEIPHVIADAGRVVAEADVPGWTAALGALIESRAARADLAARGRARAEAVYAWPVVARAHLDFFDRLTDSPNTGDA